MAEEVLVCHGSETLKMPFCRGTAEMNGLLSGAVEAPGPLLLARQFLADLAARLKRDVVQET